MPIFTEMKEGMRREIENFGSNHNDFSCKNNVDDHMMENMGDMDFCKIFFRNPSIGMQNVLQETHH